MLTMQGFISSSRNINLCKGDASLSVNSNHQFRLAQVSIVKSFLLLFRHSDPRVLQCIAHDFAQIKGLCFITFQYAVNLLLNLVLLVCLKYPYLLIQNPFINFNNCIIYVYKNNFFKAIIISNKIFNGFCCYIAGFF